MPKMKTHRGAAKRFKRTKSGKIKRATANRRHILTKMSKGVKRGLRTPGRFIHAANVKAVLKMLRLL